MISCNVSPTLLTTAIASSRTAWSNLRERPYKRKPNKQSQVILSGRTVRSKATFGEVAGAWLPHRSYSYRSTLSSGLRLDKRPEVKEIVYQLHDGIIARHGLQFEQHCVDLLN